MQFEHDKEIEALLRKAAQRDIKAPAPGTHLDADEISMFAENAMPDGGRVRAIGHFADCDRCRTILSGVINLNAAEAPPEVVAPAVVPTVAAAKPQQSWISRLFATKQLALGFGALAVLFAGFLGYTMLSGLQSGESEMAKANESATAPATAEQAANVNTPDTSAADNSEAGALRSQITNEADDLNRKEQAVLQPSPEFRSGRDVAVPVEKPRFDGFADSKKDLDPARDIADAEETDAVEAQREQLPSVVSADKVKARPEPAPPPVAAGERRSVLTPRGEGTPVKKESPEAKKANEAASVGAVATEANKGEDEASVSATRSIGGKRFVLRNSAWYDTAYKNQASLRVRRGTAEYRSLDAGLRVIGNGLSGTVYVVWKSKAYKIQ